MARGTQVLRSRLTPSFNQAFHSVRESLNGSANRIQDLIDFTAFFLPSVTLTHRPSENRNTAPHLKKKNCYHAVVSVNVMDG